jgi:hypothetical protein
MMLKVFSVQNKVTGNVFYSQHDDELFIDFESRTLRPNFKMQRDEQKFYIQNMTEEISIYFWFGATVFLHLAKVILPSIFQLYDFIHLISKWRNSLPLLCYIILTVLNMI